MDITPGNVLIVGDFATGQLVKGKIYNSLATALLDSNSGDVIQSYLPIEPYTPVTGVSVVFAQQETNYYYCRLRIFQQTTNANIELRNLTNPNAVAATAYDMNIADSVTCVRVENGRYTLRFTTNGVGGFIPAIQNVLTGDIDWCPFQEVKYRVFSAFDAMNPSDPLLPLGYVIVPANAAGTADLNLQGGEMVLLTVDDTGALSGDVLSGCLGGIIIEIRALLKS